MKDPYFISFSPPHRWTDHMLRVHAFYCVLALTLVSLLHPSSAPGGSAGYSVPACRATQTDQRDHQLLSRSQHRQASSGRPTPCRARHDSSGSSTRTHFPRTPARPFSRQLVYTPLLAAPTPQNPPQLALFALWAVPHEL